ncbi:hypothetical protein IMCC3317_27200 [Kordia antarctica]|uniref:Membrane metalloprotease n=1 Tax=Kordia antarctica TaxID=1218801 RepID=A0A7L4ZLG2_9FLAO|nr:membrane metalloprotease [Kordia antarctica]QHI37341.1 hypothetical protein IMCC3317_27200 [Kordia antarctica]
MLKKGILVLICFTFFACSEDESITPTNNGTPNPTTANLQAVGSSANDILSDHTYTSLSIEIVYVQGFEPSQTAVNNFTSFLQERTFKPDGISTTLTAIESPGNTSYTIEDISNLESIHRMNYNSDSEVVIWVFFADAPSASNTSSGVVLGTAYRNTSFVIYEQTIQELSDEPFEPNRSVLETTVIKHEFGHLLGLTNLGSALQSAHEDAEHPKHCDVDSCLMYWAAETGSGISNMISGGNAPQLDAQCIADLQANGGK